MMKRTTSDQLRDAAEVAANDHPVRRHFKPASMGVRKTLSTRNSRPAFESSFDQQSLKLTSNWYLASVPAGLGDVWKARSLTHQNAATEDTRQPGCYPVNCCLPHTSAALPRLCSGKDCPTSCNLINSSLFWRPTWNASTMHKALPTSRGVRCVLQVFPLVRSFILGPSVAGQKPPLLRKCFAGFLEPELVRYPHQGQI